MAGEQNEFIWNNFIISSNLNTGYLKNCSVLLVFNTLLHNVRMTSNSTLMWSHLPHCTYSDNVHRMEERYFLFSLFIICDLKVSVFFWHKSTNYLVEKKTFISIKLINWHSKRALIQVNCESQPNFLLEWIKTLTRNNVGITDCFKTCLS